MFTPVIPRNLSDDVVDQVVSAILTGKLAPGDRLPPVRECAERFRVTRQVIGEALHKLQQKGLVEVRKPEGTFVCLLSPSVIHEPMAQLLTREVEAVANFLDVRKWLEGMSAAASATRAIPSDVRRIEATLRPLRAAARHNDREMLDRSDVTFHLAIAAATHDPAVVGLMEMFRSLMWVSHGCRTVILEPTDFGHVCDEHEAIATAIRGRHPDEARAAMVHHIAMIQTRINRLYDQTRIAPRQRRSSSKPPGDRGVATEAMQAYFAR